MEANKICEDETRDYAENIINTVREPLVILDHDLRVVSASRSFYKVFKVNPEETVGQLIYDLGNQQWDIPKLRDLLETILPQKTTFDDYEVEHDFVDIGRRIMLLNARQIESVPGKERIILLAIEDITEHRQLEILLADSEKRYRRLFETANDGILLLEKSQGTIVQANPAAEKMFGYSETECIGKKLQALGVPIDMSDFPALMKDLDKCGVLNYDDVQVKTRSGQTIDTDIYMVDKAALAQCNIRDISERKLAEIVLKEEKKFIENALNTLTDIFFVLNLEGKPLRWNKTLNAVTGYNDREISLMTFTDFFLKDEKKPVSAAVLKGIKEDIIIVEAMGVTKDGIQIPYELSMAHLKDIRGKFIGISGVARNITERKKAEAETALQQKLRNSLLALHRMTDATEKEIYDFVLDAGLVLSGSEFGFIGKMSADEVTEIILSWSKGIMKQCALAEGSGHFPDAPASLWREMIRQRRPIIVNDYGTSTESKKGYPEGHVPIKRFLGIPVFNSGRIVAVAGGVNKETEYTESDVSSLTALIHEAWSLIERKKSEVSLRESEERFRQIAESTKEWIWEVNGDGLYTYASQVVEEMLGYTPEEVVGKKYFYDSFPTDKKEQMKKEALTVFAEKSLFVKYVSSHVHKNGGIVFLETSGLPIYDSRGDFLGYRGINIDTTERQKLEAQLRHSQKMEAVGTLAGGIAHDFNNILNIIMGYGVMVMDTLSADNPAKEDMNEVLSAADRAADLTKRLLVFSRKQIAEVKSVNVNELIFDLKKLLVRIIRESIELNFDLVDRPLVVKVDAGEIEQVLINLASNARDAMLEGGRLTISTGLEKIDQEFVEAYGYGKPGKYALITVTDTGPGMDAETQKKIFEPFFTTKGIGEGTGLGLAISYGIIKQHNGFIKVYSEPGQGTAFKILLPLSEKTAAEDKKSDAAASVMGGNETVLVAEDDAALMKLTKTVLESFGYSVITAEDGENAITKFMGNRERIDLVMLDMIMPKKSGKEVSEVVKKIDPRMKVLFASGYAMNNITNEELTESGFDFIRKPFRPKDLLIKLREILDR